MPDTIDTTPPLTPEQADLLNKLGALINFGGERIMSKPPELKARPRSAVIFSMMVAIHNYAESIFILLRSLRTNSAELLMRPLVETLINLSYILIGRNEKNAITFILDDEFDRKDLADKMRTFLLIHPKLKTSLDTMTKPDDWQKFIDDREKDIAKIRKRYPYHIGGIPNLRQRAEAYDTWQAGKHKRELKTRFEWWYLTMYWYLSSITHLTPRGLGSFLSTDARGNISINLSGDPSSLKRIVIFGYTIYYQFIRIYGLRFKVLTEEDLKPYLETIKAFA